MQKLLLKSWRKTGKIVNFFLQKLALPIHKREMVYESWTCRLGVLTSELHPLLRELNRDDSVSFCLKKRPDMMDYIKNFMNDKPRKSDEVAWECMKIGDSELLKECFEESLLYYTNCIFYAPDNSSNLPLALLKRSHVLLNIGRFKESINDVDVAVSYGLAMCDLRRAELTKARAMFELGKYEKAQKLAFDALETMKQLHEDSETKALRLELSEFLARKEKFMSHDTEDRVLEWKLPSVKNGESPDFSYASNCLTVEYDSVKGRYVTAKNDIRKGDVLFAEKPFSFVLDRSCKNNCSHCLSYSLAVIPCVSCLDEQYCCLECRNSAWKSYHQYECGFYDLLAQIGIGHLSLRTFLNLGSNIDEINRTEKDLENGFPKSIASRKNRHENILNLVTHEENIETDDLLQYSMTATLISLYLVHCTKYATPSDKNIRLCAKFLLKTILLLISNASTVTSIEIETKGKASLIPGEYQTQIAAALYPSVSIMNHSCEPQLIQCFYKSYVVMRAWKDIKKGEEVFNMYKAHHVRMERSERQKMLKSQYFFECKCGACSTRFDRYDVLNSFSCGKCKGPLVKEPEARDDDDNWPLMLCLKCSYYERISEERFAQRAEILKLIERGDELLFDDCNPSGALLVFIKSWKMGRKIFYMFHEDLNYSAHQIARCLCLLEDYKRCLMFLKCTVLSNEGRFGSLSSELAFQAKAFGDVVNHYSSTVLTEIPDEESKKQILAGIRHYELSGKIFEIIYGTDHPIVSEIEKCKSNLLRHKLAISPMGC